VKKSIIAVVVVAAALVGAAAAAVPVVQDIAASRLKAEFERNGGQVGAVEVGLLDRRVTLRDLKIAGAGELSVGRWEVSGLAWPLGELIQGRTPLAGFRWGDPLQAERIELQDVRLDASADGSRWSVSSLVVEGFDLSRYDATYDGRYRSEVLLARAIDALKMRRLEERNLLFTLPVTGDTFGAASVLAERYERGRIASLTGSSLEATDRDGQAPLYKIAEMKLTGLDMSRVIAALSSRDWQPGAPSGRLTFENGNASGFGGEMLRRYGISLGSVSVETVRESDKLSRMRSRIEGFVLAPPLRGVEGLQTRMVMMSMGLKEVKADFDCTGIEDRAKGELASDRCALVGPGLGEIDLTGRIVNADPAFWRALDDSEWLALNESKAALGAARLVFADKSLLERGLKALATMTGKPLAETRANLAREIRLYQPSDVMISQDMTKFLDTVARFVEQGGTLTVNARPEPPIDAEGFQSLWKPGADIVQLLGLSASLSK
jgi:hypothetical protein